METETHNRSTRTDNDSWDQLDFSDSDEVLDMGLSESQLREEYDNEEIERFLSHFAANVTEVHIPPSPPPTPNVSSKTGWVASSFSEDIAVRYLLPYLPPSPPPPPAFTLGRLRLATQRLYLSTVPVYIPFSSRLLKLAFWEEKHMSGCYCLIYWVLWYYDLLLPALILRILYSLVRRRIFPYPTSTELRERQIEIELAKELGDEVSTRLASSSSFDIPEMWRIFRLITKSVKRNVRKHEVVKDRYRDRKEKGKSQETTFNDCSGVVIDTSTVLDSRMENRQEKDFKRSALECASTIADFHERIHNLFIWRRPKVSFNYGVLMAMCFFLTLLLPAQYIAKLVYFVTGILFWHVVPVIAALPNEDQARLHPPLFDVPTDADYTMELISQRINAGLDVRPQRMGHQKGNKVKIESDTKITSRSPSPNTDKNINWKKWGERAAISKAWAVDKKLIGANKEWPQTSNASQMPPAATAVGQPLSPVESHSFPCQHLSGPGLITLSPAIFYFTPLMAPHPAVAFPLNCLKVVKKSGLLKGLTLRWADTKDEENEHEEIFKWVGGRDELFARLIGSDFGKWRRA